MLDERQEHAGGWTPDRVERLRHLWLVDGLSASQIACVLGEGLTRNGVIGKVHRLKLSGAKAKVAAPSGKRGRVGMPGQAKAASIIRRAESRKRDLDRGKSRAATRRPERVVGDAEPELAVLPLPSGAAWLPLDDRAPVSMVDLGNHDCKWPLGDPLLSGFGFCGLPASDGTHYCDRHHARSVWRAA